MEKLKPKTPFCEAEKGSSSIHLKKSSKRKLIPRQKKWLLLLYLSHLKKNPNVWKIPKRFNFLNGIHYINDIQSEKTWENFPSCCYYFIEKLLKKYILWISKKISRSSNGLQYQRFHNYSSHIINEHF